VSEARDAEGEGDEAPPFGRSWVTLYAIVLANLAFWIALFALFTRAFR
jgi:hypothetical protein